MRRLHRFVVELNMPDTMLPYEGRPRKINKDIETLRAMEISFVLFHHFGFLIVGSHIYLSLLRNIGFWSGVDLFLCISGYIIAKNYYDRFLVAGRSGLGDVTLSFWIRRAYRLWPSAWLWAVVSVVLFTANGLSPLWNNVTDAAAAFFEVANFNWWWCLKGNGACGSIGNYWSLALEEQFYLLFPSLFVLPRRYHLGIVFTIAMIQFPIPRGHWSPDFFAFIRTDAIALGVCVYLLSRTALYRQLQPEFLTERPIALVVGVGLIASLAIFTAPEAAPERAIVPFATGMVALLSAALVFIASYDRDWLLDLPILRPVLMWIASRSYALYLIQTVAYQGVQRFVACHAVHDALPPHWIGVFTSIASFASMGILAELNFRFVETPMRKRGVRLSREYTARSLVRSPV